MRLDMLLQRLFREEPAFRSGGFVLKVRLCLLSAAWVHLCIVAMLILSQDLSQDEDPKVRVYERLKWRFITAWFNLINLGYFPLCLYCDWKEKTGRETDRLVGRLRRVRDVVFTSVLFPTILWADFLFWRLYYMDMTLITPPHLFDYMPPGGQHSLHTVSFFVAIADLLLTPRRRPKSLHPRLKLMTAFFLVYCVVILERYVKGEMVYQMLDRYTGTEVILFVVLCYIEYLLYFSLQWFVIKFLWGKEGYLANPTRWFHENPNQVGGTKKMNSLVSSEKTTRPFKDC